MEVTRHCHSCDCKVERPYLWAWCLCEVTLRWSGSFSCNCAEQSKQMETEFGFGRLEVVRSGYLVNKPKRAHS